MKYSLQVEFETDAAILVDKFYSTMMTALASEINSGLIGPFNLMVEQDKKTKV